MLDQFNQQINFIITEAFDLSPKFIDKDFQGSFNKIDLFTSKKFFKGIPSETFIAQEFIKKLNEKININEINFKFNFMFSPINCNIIIFLTRYSIYMLYYFRGKMAKN